MKLFFDFEFTGLHAGTTPISLGIVAEYIAKIYGETKARPVYIIMDKYSNSLTTQK